LYLKVLRGLTALGKASTEAESGYAERNSPR